MLIDCNSCVMRDLACDDCVVSMILGPTPANLEKHQDALQVLAGAGIVAPLRLVKSSEVSKSNKKPNLEDRNIASAAQ